MLDGTPVCHTKYQWDDEIKRNWRSNISYCELETTKRCNVQQDSSKPAGEPQINLIFLRSITQTGSVLYIHMLILVYTQWHVYVTQPALSYDGLKLLGDLCKKQKEPMIYQWEA